MSLNDQIKQLREETELSIMQCKKALEESEGDMEKARTILSRYKSAAAEKKADRTLGAGTIQSYVHAGGEIGVLVMLSSETDFVAKNDEFVQLAYDIAMHIAAANPQYLSREQVSEEAHHRLQEVYVQEAADKPADVQEKVVAGKLNAYYSERVLLEQPYIKDQEKTINDLVQEATQKFGERVEISDFARLSTRG